MKKYQVVRTSAVDDVLFEELVERFANAFEKEHSRPPLAKATMWPFDDYESAYLLENHFDLKPEVILESTDPKVIKREHPNFTIVSMKTYCLYWTNKDPIFGIWSYPRKT